MVQIFTKLIYVVSSHWTADLDNIFVQRKFPENFLMLRKYAFINYENASYMFTLNLPCCRHACPQ